MYRGQHQRNTRIMPPRPPALVIREHFNAHKFLYLSSMMSGSPSVCFCRNRVTLKLKWKPRKWGRALERSEIENIKLCYRKYKDSLEAVGWYHSRAFAIALEILCQYQRKNLQFQTEFSLKVWYLAVFDFIKNTLKLGAWRWMRNVFRMSKGRTENVRILPGALYRFRKDLFLSA